MPRGKPKVAKNQEEIAKSIVALEAAKAATASAEDGNNKFIQAQAKALLERVEADRAAKATDEPSGISVGVDNDFLKQDPTKFEDRLQRKGIERRLDHRYRWINRDPRRIERRIQAGWLPVQGASITNGDSVLASMPEEMAKTQEKQLADRKKIAETAHIQRLEAEGAKQGMEVFTDLTPLRSK
jgi:hypothetical protein